MFDIIAGKYTRDAKFPLRTHDLNLLLRVVAPELDGGIYDLPKGSNGALYPFHKDFLGKTYLPLDRRRPNVPEGTNTLRQAIVRQASMVFGSDRFPAIETANADARATLNAFIEEAEIEDRMREAIVLGSVGSVAQHIRVLAPPGGKARIYVENYPTAYLTPTFDPYRPDQLVKVVEKYKTPGRALVAEGYDIADEDLGKQFWFMRVWDDQAEIWYVPWTADDEAKDGFSPVVDDGEGKTTEHQLGFCPWLWIKNSPMGRGIDGTCQFQTALDHAVNLDYLASQIARAVKYTMDPTMVIEKPATAPGAPTTAAVGGEAGFAKTPSTILIIDAQGKAYYMEISGEGIEKARQVANDLRKAIIEACHGDRIDPEKITQAHQGAKTISQMNQPMLGLCDQLRSSYGTALKRLLKMVAQIIEHRAGKNFPGVEVNGEVVDGLGKINDLKLVWGVYYADTPAELYAEAQAMDLNLRNGLLSHERAMNNIAGTYAISDINEELKKVAKDQTESDARAIKLAEATAQVKVMDNISNG